MVHTITATDFTYAPFEAIHDYPETFDDLLKAPTFLINLDRYPERRRICTERITAAGFTNVQLFPAIDGKSPETITEGWTVFHNPHQKLYDYFWSKTGIQGVALSHLYLWKKVVDEKIPYMNVFEDDILFHSEWQTLAPDFFARTPKKYDMLYTGAQIEFQSDKEIDQVRVFCTHSYTIRYNGAKKLLDMFMNVSVGMYTIDCMIIEMMDNVKQTHPFDWIVWNARSYESKIGNDMNADWKKRNDGLVFQDEKFVSDTYAM